MNDVRAEIKIGEKLPVYRKCLNCNGYGYLRIALDEGSTAGPILTTCSCYKCNSQGVVPTGDFAYQTPQGLVLEDE